MELNYVLLNFKIIIRNLYEGIIYIIKNINTHYITLNL